MTNIKLLKISKPQCVELQEKHIKANIILVAKYLFKAEGSSELTVNKGDILKLLDRPGNGWVLVKSIEKLQTPGLVPASYVDIAVNDTINPVTLSWIRETNSGQGSSPIDGSSSPFLNSTSFGNQPTQPHSPSATITAHNSSYSALSSSSDINSVTKSYNDAQIQDLITSNKAKTFNNRTYPISASILNFLLYNERYWYRVDVKFSDDSKMYLGRYYQDFYNLHCSLLETSSSSSLPKLPEPIPLAKQKDRKELNNMLLKRCNDLHVYINELILNRESQLSVHFFLWLTNENAPGFIVKREEMSKFHMKNDDINEKVLKGSVKVFEADDIKQDELPQMLEQGSTDGDETQINDNSSEESNSASEAQSTADTTPDNSTGSPDFVRRTRSKNTYNHYQQINSFEGLRNHSIKRTGSNTSTIKLAGSSQNPSRAPSQNHGHGHILGPPNQANFAPPLPTTNTQGGVNHPLQHSPKVVAPLKLNMLEHNQPMSPSGSPQPNIHAYTHYPPSNGSLTGSGGSTSRKNSLSGRRPSSRKGSIGSHQQTHVQYGGYYNQHLAGQVHMHGDAPIEYVKCKIVKLNEEIIAIKLDKSLIRGLEDFKLLLKQKVHFNKLLIKLPNYEDFKNIDDIKLDIVQFLKVNDKAWLKTV